MSLTGCDRCDWHGPDFETLEASGRDLHRAGHAAKREVEEVLEPQILAILDRLTRY